MKTTTVLAIALGIGALAACKQSPQEQKADNIEANAENTADTIEANTSNASENVESATRASRRPTRSAMARTPTATARAKN
jgi:outer membrane lipoprotein-sorting protein